MRWSNTRRCDNLPIKIIKNRSESIAIPLKLIFNTDTFEAIKNENFLQFEKMQNLFLCKTKEAKVF